MANDLAALRQVLEVDKLVHEPARLVVLAILASVESADFTFLMEHTHLTQGNLSAHLAKLEAGGFIHVDKSFVGKRPRTTLSLTAEGRTALLVHKKALKEFLNLIE